MTLEELELRVRVAFRGAEITCDGRVIRCTLNGLLGDRKLAGFDAWPDPTGRGGYFMRPNHVGELYVDRARHNRWIEEIRGRIDSLKFHDLIAARRRLALADAQ